MKFIQSFKIGWCIRIRKLSRRIVLFLTIIPCVIGLVLIGISWIIYSVDTGLGSFIGLTMFHILSFCPLILSLRFFIYYFKNKSELRIKEEIEIDIGEVRFLN